MEDPSLARRTARPIRHGRQLLALAFGLVVLFLSATAAAGDEGILSPLPPVAGVRPITEAWGTAPANVEPSGAALFSGDAVRSEQTLPFQSNFRQLGYQEPAINETGEPKFQLTSFFKQEPAAPEAVDAPNADGPGSQADGQQPPTYGRQPESTKLQFLRTQDVLLAQGAWQFDTGFAYTHFDNDLPVGVIDNNTNDLAGVVEGHLRRRILYTPLAVRYGLTRNVQFFAVLPSGFSDTQLSTFGTSQTTNVSSIGDLTSGVSVHLLKGEDQLPDVIGTFGFTAPTGKFSAPIFGVVPGSNLGQGFWALSGQLLFIHTYDPIIVFYGGGYRHLFERTFQGFVFTPGEQINYQFGVGFAVNDRITLSTAFQGFYLTTNSLDHVTTRGTNLEPLSLRFAATIARNCRILEPFVQIGLTDSAPNANVGITVTFY